MPARWLCPRRTCCESDRSSLDRLKRANLDDRHLDPIPTLCSNHLASFDFYKVIEDCLFRRSSGSGSRISSAMLGPADHYAAGAIGHIETSQISDESRR